ncbi:hypothetical protein ABB44_03470 [Companilactobacillus farciminis]|nr:hypothetical protein ABB45_03465 [Companilactobacillus farciminis]AKS51054.1 hypothetical protein ABB44_03470 [Companilactobacillus farciminis]
MADISCQLDSNMDKIIENKSIKIDGSKNKCLRRKLKHYNRLLKNDFISRFLYTNKRILNVLLKFNLNISKSSPLPSKNQPKLKGTNK